MKKTYTIKNFAKRLVMVLVVGLVAVNAWGATFTKITSLSDLTTGDYVIVGQKGSSSYGRFIYGTPDKSKRLAYTEHYTSSLPASITTTTANEIWRLTVSGTGASRTVTIYNSGQSKYLTANSALGWDASSSNATSFTVTASSNQFVFAVSTTYLGVNSSANYWRDYASTTVYQTNCIILYKAPSGYAITWNNGGHGTAPTSPTAATSLTLAAITGVAGYTCTGWKANVAVTNTSTSASISAGTLIANGTNVTLSGATTFTAQWSANNYTIDLNNQSATTAGTSSIAVTYDATTNLTETPAITKPTKTHYDFGGYYTAVDGGGSQIIDANGDVVASVSNYTSSTKQWIKADNVTLYAKWTEHGLKNYRTVCCTDPGLAYGTVSVTKTYGEGVFTNTLTNSHSVVVTYSSSDETVATVNGSGQVTILKAGSTTITASSTAQTVAAVSYCADEASYTLTVNKANISPTLTYTPNSVAVGENTSAPTVGGNPGSGGVTYAITSATPAGCATIDAGTGVVSGVAVGSVTVTATVAATTNYNGGSATANVTITAASYFPNGKTIFIQAESSSAWSDANYDCVKAWFHTAGGSETAQTTYWLFDATGGDSGKKLFAAIVPATGDLPYLDIQRFTHDCSLWRNKNGGCSYSDANGSNTIRSTGNTDTYDAKDDYIRWNATGVTMNLMSSDAWLTPVASMTDQGSGIWSGSYEYTPSNTSTEYVIATNYNGNIGNTGSNSNATLSGMVVGSTYDVTATLDIKDHSLEMSKTFVKGTVHFNLQGHGSAISDLTNVTAGSKISAPSPAPTDAAYDFGGWYKEPACTNAWNFASDVVNETMTLYAKWTPHNFTITYEGLAGASNTNPTSYTIETATIVLANPGSRTGYTFTGWTLGGSPITQIVLGTTGDKTITATWSINTPNLAVSAADHVVITATPASESAIAEGANRNVNYNKTVTLNCTPDEHWNLVWDVYKTGESSTKVALSGSGDGATFMMPDYAVTVSAVMTEAAYKTVCFKNNGEDIDGYASVKVYVGESPVAPTLTDGTSGDACDPTSDKHYGWTKETWTSTIATQSEIDARTGTEAVYEKSAALPVVGAGDPATITYHAVWAAGSGSPAINSTLIAKWDKQALTASTAVKAKDKDGNTLNDVTMTSSFNLATEGTYCYQNTITSTVTITISGLDFSAYDKGALSFYARGSQTRTIDVDYSTGGAYSDLVTTPKITKKEQAYEISNIPKATTSIKLTYVYGTSGETFYFGTVRAYGVNNTPSYEFTELTDDNTSGWTGSDWDGYYIITGNSSTKALRSSGICGFSDFATVSAVDSKISTSDIGLIFRINYSSENSGFVVQGLGGGDYMATEKVNSDAFSIMTTTVAYLYGMSYNSLAHTSSTYLKWSTDRFGIYSSSTGVNPTLYKMLGAAENFLTTCCTQYDISGASTSGTAVTGGTLTSTDNSACEDREVKITANVSDGYRFDSWTITAGGSPVARKDGSAEIEDGNPIYVFDMPAADVTVSAAFTRVYPVTYDANGGTGEMIDVNSPYAAGDKVTVLANTFTKAGYNFDSWSYSPAVSVTDGKFDMPSSDVTITAQWTAKPLNNIILAQTEAEIYDQQYVQIDVTYDPADIVTKGYTLTGPALTKVVTTGSTQTQLKISATKAGVIISEVVSETVSIKANADETKTASVVVTIKPLPRVHFTDIIHNVVFGDVVEEIVGNVLSGAKTTPTHSDISDPGASYNTCERQHLHLLGWIESTWADAHPGATPGEITGAGSSIYYEAGASINVEVQNGKTFYAVWCIVE